MHDIKWIRENPEAFDAALKRRGAAAQSAAVLAADEAHRQSLQAMQAMEQERNQLAKSIGMFKGQGKHDEAEKAVKRANEIKEAIARFKEAQERGDNPAAELLATIPNLLAADVPEGADESGNKQIKKWGEPPKLGFAAKDHIAIGEGLGGMDFETAAKMSGSRFVLLKGPIARLERALAQFMLDLHTEEFGYQEVSPPLLVRKHALYGTGQLPKFVQDLFYVPSLMERLANKPVEGEAPSTKAMWNEIHKLALPEIERITGAVARDLYLIPTAEVSLTNIMSDEVVAEESLPHRYTAHTPCFRSEAGAAGKDTKGMIRQHQFAKVELVSITHPDESDAEHERMTRAAETVLEKLKLPYRRMLLCAGDTGFSARKTYDLEVWLPGQNTYREISSCSNCGDFQARRMKARFRPKGQEKGTEFVHTLNGSGVAVGRALIAVLENYQQADGSVVVPEVLRPYMGGLEKIGKN
jgi:seryl-tRNA synthetase